MRGLWWLWVGACVGPAEEVLEPEGPVETEQVGLYEPTLTPQPVRAGETPTFDAGVPVQVRFDPRPCAEPSTGYTRVELPALDPVPATYAIDGGSLSVADLDGDGLLDVLVGAQEDAQLFMQHPDGSFHEESERLAGDLLRMAAATPADVDGDGDLDLVVARYQQPTVVLHNDGEGIFTDATEASGVVADGRCQSVSLGDMDRDGDLDLVIGAYGPDPTTPLQHVVEQGDPNFLFENLGDGTFVDRSERLPASIHDSYTFMTSWRDMDLDGHDDLLVVVDFGWSRPGGVLWNRDEGLVLDDGSAGIDIPFAGMGLGIGDINGDEIPDLLQSSWRDASLLVSKGGFWTEEAPGRSLIPVHETAPDQRFGWGAELADLDNDGDDDAVIAFGHWERYGGLRAAQGDAVFIQDEHGSFSDQAVAYGMRDISVTRGLLVVDLNGDGRLDVLKRRLGQTTTLDLSTCGEEAWLEVVPRMSGVNSHAIGARVRFIGPDRVWSRQVHAGGTSMYSASPAQVHVGLGDLDEVEVEVVWPGGEVSRLGVVDTRQVLHITR